MRSSRLRRAAASASSGRTISVVVDTAAADDSGLGRKLAGILVETAPLGPRRVAVIGIGINIHAPVAMAETATPAASLDELDPAATATTTLARIAPPLFAALRVFDADGLAPFAARFAARDVLRGRRVAGSGAAGPLEGTAAGIGADGSLLVAAATGTVAVASGEWRLARADAARAPC